jgi:hypothetical protein
MGVKIFYTLFYTTHLLCFSTLFFSSFVYFKRKIEKKYFLIVIYFLINSIIVVATEILRIFFPKLAALHSHIFLVFPIIHFLFLSNFIIGEIESINEKNKKFFFIIFILLFLVVMIYDFIMLRHYSSTLSNVGLIILCIYYFKKLASSSSIVNFKSDSAFLLITGVFYSSGILLPILLFSSYLRMNFPEDTFYLIGTLSPIASAILYILSLKSFLCLYRIKK